MLAALIPLNELAESYTMKKYGLKPDPETLDILSCAARQKQVKFVLIFITSEFLQNFE